jgi:threonine dehydrogenase-like Zn-dependent dehydrogenase
LGPRQALGGWSLLSLREIASPSSPGPGWVRLRTLRSGICGSDVKEVLLQAAADNPLSGVVSFPHVPGHEVVAQVDEAPLDSGLRPGQLVALDPWVGCRARGLEELCPACAGGFPPHCRCQPDGGAWGKGGGLHLGNIRGLPGGFAEIIHAHSSQCHPLPQGLDPDLGVLADPLAVALHAVERAGAQPSGPVLVLGAGTIGLGLTLAARARWPEVPVWTTAAWPHQVPLISELGAEPVGANAEEVIPELARRTGARQIWPWRGGPWLMGSGAALVLDSIGNRSTTELALRCLAPRGRIVVVGVGKPERTENTLAYYKEAEIIGCNGYGRDVSGDAEPHLLDKALAILVQRGPQLRRWCTHTFPLERYREAFALAARPWPGAAIKVSLELGEEQSQ